MIPRFFIDRPIFAAVLSLVVLIAGVLSVKNLPIAQYPKVTPPTVQVDCNFPGADSQTVSDTIAAPIEQQVNGVEDMLYMSSQCTNDGSYTLTVTFRPGSDLNMCQVRVLNRVALAMPALPPEVRQTGLTTRKRSPELLMTVSVNSPERPGHAAVAGAAIGYCSASAPSDSPYDQLYLSNYVSLHLKEELQRLPGISDVTIFGQRDYSMRIWVNPEKLAARNLTPADVVGALRGQNLPIAAGQIGQDANGQYFQFTISAIGRLTTEEEFADVVLKVGDQGQLVRIKDVARVELDSKNSDVNSRFDRKPTTGLGIFLLSNANSVETSELVKAKLEDLAKDFPPGVHWEIGYDTAPFIVESIREVFKSLRDAVALVAIVVLVFLGSWRAAIIPLAAVPVAIIGTFGAMYVAGFSVNNLTLFGLVLAVGIVVDDAIVVVEAVQHKLDLGFAPREATIRAMEDVAGPVIAVGVVLSAVFIPCAFLSGIVGSFFRQFALTIAVSTMISTLNSLTLSPALAALLLKPRTAAAAKPSILGRIVGILFLPFTLFQQAFERVFSWCGRLYVRGVAIGLRVPLFVLAGYVGIMAAGAYGYRSIPTGFIPQQDKGYLVASIQLPDSASSERTVETLQEIAKAALEYEVSLPAAPGEEGAVEIEKDGVKRWVRKVRPISHTNAIAGNSFVLSAYGSNFGSMFIIMKDFDERRHPDLYSARVIQGLQAACARKVPGAQVNIFGAPAVPGLGRAGGFRIMIEDRGDAGPLALEQQTRNFVDKANQLPQAGGMFTVYKTNVPQIYLDIDRAACMARGVEVTDVSAALQGSMGSRYVNDFNRFGRTWQVNVQADEKYRDSVDDIRKIKVRNRQGDMVPLAAVTKVRERGMPQVITRYNTYPAAAINGNVAPGVSNGDLRLAMERLADQELPPQIIGYEWTELTFLEEKAGRSELRLPGGVTFRGDTTVMVFGLSVAFVFLILAALYESWAFPLAVILVVPVCVAAALGAVWLTDPGSALETLKVWGVGNERMLASAAWVDTNLIAGANKPLAGSGIFKQDINIFTQVGFVVLIGLACKNAILIVEFAKVARDGGADLRTAVLEACTLRFRPIMMTSVAFILGVLPLAMATGAGAEMRQALGVAVLGGMVGVTLFGIFLTPIFFAIVDRLTNTHLLSHRWVRAASAAALYVIRLRFLPPLAAAVQKKLRGLTKNRPMS
jgi:multidrug efflux pump